MNKDEQSVQSSHQAIAHGRYVTTAAMVTSTEWNSTATVPGMQHHHTQLTNSPRPRQTVDVTWQIFSTIIYATERCTQAILQ